MFRALFINLCFLSMVAVDPLKGKVRCDKTFDPSRFLGDWTLVTTVMNGTANYQTAFVSIQRLSSDDKEYFGIDDSNVTNFFEKSEGSFSSKYGSPPLYMPKNPHKNLIHPSTAIKMKGVNPNEAFKLNIHDNIWDFNALIIPKDSCGRMDTFATGARTPEMRRTTDWFNFEVKLDVVNKFLVIMYDDDRHTTTVALKPGSHSVKQLRKVVRGIVRNVKRPDVSYSVS